MSAIAGGEETRSCQPALPDLEGEPCRRELARATVRRGWEGGGEGDGRMMGGVMSG
jgi:hypothetical protein